MLSSSRGAHELALSIPGLPSVVWMISNYVRHTIWGILWICLMLFGEMYGWNGMLHNSTNIPCDSNQSIVCYSQKVLVSTNCSVAFHILWFQLWPGSILCESVHNHAIENGKVGLFAPFWYAFSENPFWWTRMWHWKSEQVVPYRHPHFIHSGDHIHHFWVLGLNAQHHITSASCTVAEASSS